MFAKNTRFEEFRKELLLRDVEIRWAWSAKRDRSTKYDDVGMVFFVGRGFQPKILTAIVINYGPDDGFGLYIDRGGQTIAADAQEIAGRDPTN